MKDEVGMSETQSAPEEELETAEAEMQSEEVETPVQDCDEGLTPSTSEFKWYIAQAMTGQENKVQRQLRERIANYKMSEFFSKIVVPEETVVSNTNGKKRTIKKKLFPGYILIHMIMNDKTWHLVKNTDKVTGFIGGTLDKPSPLSDEDAAAMTNQSQEGAAKRPRTTVDFSEGDTVKVTEGPFAGFVGQIESVNEKGKIKVNVSIFGRPTPVELDFSQVEKA